MIRIEREDFVRDQGLEQGLQQGLEQDVKKGRQEGRQEGQQAIVINLLDHTTPEQVAKATKVPLSEVLAASKKTRQELERSTVAGVGPHSPLVEVGPAAP